MGDYRNILVSTLKPGATLTGITKQTFLGDVNIKLEGGGDLILMLNSMETGYLDIYDGETIFAGGKKRIQIPSYTDVAVYLENAPYVYTEAGEKVIHAYTDIQLDIYAIQLA